MKDIKGQSNGKVINIMKNNAGLDDVPDDFLQEYGIEFQVPQFDLSELESQGYRKAPDEEFARLSAIFQYAPALIATDSTLNSANRAMREMSEGAYKAVIKNGMQLVKSRELEGAFRGMTRNGKDIAQANFIPVSVEPLSAASLAVLGTFNALSIVTSQYFLSQINNRLSSMEEIVDRVLDYLEAETDSELDAGERNIGNIIRDAKQINNNDWVKTTALTELKDAKRTALESIQLYTSQLNSATQRLATIKKKKELINSVSEFGRNLSQYWRAVNLYGKALFLMVLFSNEGFYNISDEYLNNLYNDVSREKERYLSQYESCISALNKRAERLFFDKVEEDDEEDFYEFLEDEEQGIFSNMVQRLSGFGVSHLQRRIAARQFAKFHETLNSTIQDKMSLCKEMEPIDATLQDINHYREWLRSPIELIKTQDAVYYRQVTESIAS